MINFLSACYFPQFPLISFPCVFSVAVKARRSQNVKMVKVKMRKGNVKNRHYNINILFIYSEQMTESDIDFDQNDHDHDDHGVDLSVITNHIILAGNNKNRPFHRDFLAWQFLSDILFPVLRLNFSYHETIITRKQTNFAVEFKQTMRMDITLIFTVALAATLIVVVLALVVVIIYQRWRIGDQNVFIERFIRQNEEQRQKMKKAGIV